METTCVDVTVVGAGAVGLATALALHAQGRKVAVIGAPPAAADGRTVALLDASWRFLQAHGVDVALASKAAPLRVMRLIDDTDSLFRPPPVDFRASEIGLDAFGWNVPNTELVTALSQMVVRTAGIAFHHGAVDSIVPDEHGVSVGGSGFAPLRSQLVVGADGKGSLSRKAADIAAREWQYDQMALTGLFDHVRDHHDASTEFHTRQGPCTLVPLPGRRSSLVWMMSPRVARRISRLDDAAFALAVEHQTHSLLGRMTLTGPRGMVSMGGLSVDRYAANRIALVGEAAHTFPPIGAQGLNLGFRDAIALGEAIADSEDPGAGTILDTYDRNRRSDVRMRSTAVDALNRSLLADLLPVDFLRGAGLLALGEIGPLRRLVMRRGLGDGGSASHV
jgi:2-octaprenyl-6-methoxyphenol hydroxylase